MKKRGRKKGSKKVVRIIGDYLSRLPEPYASQAILNAGENIHKSFVGITIKDALMSAFHWDKAPEGGDYWADVANNYLL